MTATKSDSVSSSMLYAWFVVGVLLVAYIVAMMDRQILSLMVQPIRNDLGISDLGACRLLDHCRLLPPSSPRARP